jgi:NAD(P)-dependent dehydrogenase (short-subunit alcohol dehydrogenase family)
MKEYAKLFDLGGRSALVVGAASGIGEACAHGLAAFGARVACADLDLEGAERTAAGISSEGGHAEAFQLDMRDAASCSAAVERLGAPDALVITPAINVRKRATEVTDDEFRRVMELNLLGTFRVMRDFGRLMAERGRGSIVVFSSIRAQVVEPGQAVYAATKAGTLQVARTMASELGASGVRVNAVAPGVVWTPRISELLGDEGRVRNEANTPLRRVALPADIAGALLFLCSDLAAYVSGQVIVVDGGVGAKFPYPMADA